MGILDFESFNLAARRKFNQQKILCDCIKEELEDNGIYEDKDDGTYGDIHVGVDNTWKDMKSLRTYLENNAPYKSKEKYHGILDILLSHKVIQSIGFDIVKTIDAAIAKMLSPANRKGLRRQPDTLPVTVRSKRVLAALAEPTPPSLPVSDSPTHLSLPPPLKRMRRNAAVKPVQNEGKPMKPNKITRRKLPSPQRQTSTSTSHQYKPKFKQLDMSPSTELDQQEESEEARKFTFDHKQVFDDPDDTAAHTQLWELLETSPERTSPKHYVHDGKVHYFTVEEQQLRRATSTASLHSPHASGPGEAAVEATGSPVALRLLRPVECHMLPFPDCEDLRGAARAPPFPILDTAAAAAAARGHTHFGMSGF